MKKEYLFRNYSEKDVYTVAKKYYSIIFNVWHMLDICPELIKRVVFDKYELEYHVRNTIDCYDFLFLLSTHSLTLYKTLIDIAVTDYPGKKGRFKVTYLLLSVDYNSRVRVVVETDEVSPLISVWNIFGGALWPEREVWDMFGIFFIGHPDLRRILTDYGFEGHPLRKDFPLSGYVELFYDDSKKRIVYEPVSLAQEYRNFDFISPWN